MVSPKSSKAQRRTIIESQPENEWFFEKSMEPLEALRLRIQFKQTLQLHQIRATQFNDHGSKIGLNILCQNEFIKSLIGQFLDHDEIDFLRSKLIKPH